MSTLFDIVAPESRETPFNEVESDSIEEVFHPSQRPIHFSFRTDIRYKKVTHNNGVCAISPHFIGLFTQNKVGDRLENIEMIHISEVKMIAHKENEFVLVKTEESNLTCTGPKTTKFAQILYRNYYFSFSMNSPDDIVEVRSDNLELFPDITIHASPSQKFQFAYFAMSSANQLPYNHEVVRYLHNLLLSHNSIIDISQLPLDLAAGIPINQRPQEFTPKKSEPKIKKIEQVNDNDDEEENDPKDKKKKGAKDNKKKKGGKDDKKDDKKDDSKKDENKKDDKKDDKKKGKEEDTKKDESKKDEKKGKKGSKDDKKEEEKDVKEEDGKKKNKKDDKKDNKKGDKTDDKADDKAEDDKKDNKKDNKKDAKKDNKKKGKKGKKGSEEISDEEINEEKENPNPKKEYSKGNDLVPIFHSLNLMRFVSGICACNILRTDMISSFVPLVSLNENLRIVHFENCGAVTGLDELSEAIKKVEKFSVSYWNLSYNKLENFAAFADIIEYSKEPLLYLNLSFCGIDADSSAKIFNSLAANDKMWSLRFLMYAGNDVSTPEAQEGLEKYMKALSKNNNNNTGNNKNNNSGGKSLLECVDFGSVDEGLSKVLAIMNKYPQPIKKLVLKGSSNFDDECSKQLLILIQESTTLESLDLSYTNLEPETIAGIINAITTNDTLSDFSLHLNGLDLNDENLLPLFRAFLHKGLNKWKALSFDENNMTGDDLKNLLPLFLRMKHLQELSLNGNFDKSMEEIDELIARLMDIKMITKLSLVGNNEKHLEDTLSRLLRKMAKDPTKITKLDISLNNVGDSLISYINQILHRPECKLSYLNIDGNKITSTDKLSTLVDAVEGCQSLVSFQFPIVDAQEIAARADPEEKDVVIRTLSELQIGFVQAINTHRNKANLPNDLPFPADKQIHDLVVQIAKGMHKRFKLNDMKRHSLVCEQIYVPLPFQKVGDIPREGGRIEDVDIGNMKIYETPSMGEYIIEENTRYNDMLFTTMNPNIINVLTQNQPPILKTPELKPITKRQTEITASSDYPPDSDSDELANQQKKKKSTNSKEANDKNSKKQYKEKGKKETNKDDDTDDTDEFEDNDTDDDEKSKKKQNKRRGSQKQIVNYSQKKKSSKKQKMQEYSSNDDDDDDDDDDEDDRQPKRKTRKSDKNTNKNHHNSKKAHVSESDSDDYPNKRRNNNKNNKRNPSPSESSSEDQRPTRKGLNNKKTNNKQNKNQNNRYNSEDSDDYDDSSDIQIKRKSSSKKIPKRLNRYSDEDSTSSSSNPPPSNKKKSSNKQQAHKQQIPKKNYDEINDISDDDEYKQQNARKKSSSSKKDSGRIQKIEKKPNPKTVAHKKKEMSSSSSGDVKLETRQYMADEGLDNLMDTNFVSTSSEINGGKKRNTGRASDYGGKAAPPLPKQKLKMSESSDSEEDIKPKKKSGKNSVRK